MPVRLRRRPRDASPNLRTLRHGVEKETECGVTNIGDNTTTPESNVQTTAYRQTTVCFNLALNPNSAECTLNHAKSHAGTQHPLKEIGIASIS
jgi:hypothetical protein